MGDLVLIVGGARSGKSRFAQDLARQIGGDDVLFVATAEPHDDEMSRRIDLHRNARPAAWRTLEQPRDVGKAVAAIESQPRVVLLDCLTLLISNVLLQCETDADFAEKQMRLEIAELIEAAKQQEATVIVVSGEVGMGLVPENRVGRLFRDLLGWANQLLAEQAAATYMMVAGLPVNATKLASTVQDVADELASGDITLPLGG